MAALSFQWIACAFPCLFGDHGDVFRVSVLEPTIRVMHETGFRLSALDGLLQRSSGCRRHDMDPHLYFMQLLVNLPTWPARDLDAWLPDRWKQTHFARCAALGIPVPPNP